MRIRRKESAAMDSLRLYIVFDPTFPEGAGWAKFFVGQFGSLGMQRDELGDFVPVHSRSQAWGKSQPGLDGTAFPRRIDLGRASRNCIVVLVDPRMMYQESFWAHYFGHVKAQVDARGNRDLVVPLLFDTPTPSFAHRTQTIRFDSFDAPAEGSSVQRRLMIRLLNRLLTTRGPSRDNPHRPGHGIFVSHAKRDGAGIASRIVQTLDSATDRVGPNFFFDVSSLQPGHDYPDQFEAAIGQGSLLAVVTDAYHTRPWCRWEVLAAKRLGRPVVAADLTSGRVERTYPYLGNVLSVRAKPAADDPDGMADADIEACTLALLSEALRIELWRERAQAMLGKRKVHVCARPPELADLAVLQSAEKGRANGTRKIVLYPDPPLGTEETELLRHAFPALQVCTLSQLASS